MYDEALEDERKTNNPTKPIFQLHNAADKNTAIGLMCQLAQFDGRLAPRPFIDTFNEIYAGASHEQYAVATLDFDTPDGKTSPSPVGYIVWGLMNPMAGAMYAKEIRKPSPAEFKSGDELWIVQMVAPFGFREELYAYFVENVEVLRSAGRKLTLDYFEQIPHNLLDVEKSKGR